MSVLVNKLKVLSTNFGFKFKQAYELDNRNGNTKCADARKEEIDSLQKFNTFKDVGKVPFLEDHKKIMVHFVFAVKHDLRYKARLVAGGHHNRWYVIQCCLTL
jgi:hypothetical protein